MLPLPGERVLDLAAAPGGKTTHLAALMKGEGLLVANEIKDKRVGHLAQNVERWGAGNVVVTNESPERLADHFGPYFDRVLVDAPCSGEGMFRKDMGARADWSEEMVAGCAVRQKNILHVAAKLVRPGGYLLYSTCTFAPEEDEGVIAQVAGGFPRVRSGGIATVRWVFAREAGMAARQRLKDERGLSGAVRLFPHRLNGEGHFACLLRKKDGEAEERIRESLDARVFRNNWQGLWRGFAAEVLSVDLAEDRLRVAGERLYYVPELNPDFGRLKNRPSRRLAGNLQKRTFRTGAPAGLVPETGPGQK